MTRTQPTRSAKPTAEGKRKSPAHEPGPVLLIVGLGNPGGSYAGHRHNIGFMALDRVAEGTAFSPWRSKFQGEIAEGRVGERRVVLLKPMTYMNESGRAVGEAARFLKVPPEDVIVIHDELDLAPGKCRVKRGGGHAGHNGLRSIHAHIGAEYGRIRLGIGHPGRKELVAGYVLHDFARTDRDWLDPLMDGIADGFAKLVAGDEAGFQNAVALRTNPPKKQPAKAEAKPATKAPYAAKQAGRKQRDAKARTEQAIAEAGPQNPLAKLLKHFSKS
jgi:PTH1 family peptidyl-tRNA hydrolase